MSAQHPPGLNAHAIAVELMAIRKVARGDTKLHGHVLPDTKRQLDETVAKAAAFLICEDVKNQSKRMPLGSSK